MAKTNREEFMVRFETLESRVEKSIMGIWDVYLSSDHKALLYHPIMFMKSTEVLAERERLAKLGTYKLIAVKVVYEEILNRDPGRPRRTGCFRKTEWLAPDFRSTMKPKVIKNAEKFLEKESKWLSGGPRPDLNKIPHRSSIEKEK